MQKEKAHMLLCDYRQNIARSKYLESAIQAQERAAAHLRETMIEDSIHITQALSGMPRGTNTSDPTGKLAAMFADGGVTEHVRQIEAEITTKKQELAQRQMSVFFVEAWLQALNDKERLVIEKQVIDKLYWREVIKLYEKAFGELYSKHALQAMRDNALQKIYSVAE